MHEFCSLQGEGESSRTSVLDDPSAQATVRVPQLESWASATLLLLKANGLRHGSEDVDDDDDGDDAAVVTSLL